MKDQTDQVSINIFDLIDSICAEFRRQWKAGARPKIESYLLKVPENARSQLFRNLLKLELGFRRRSDESPESKEYLDRFPDYRRWIREEFDEYTLASMEAMQSTPDAKVDATTVTLDAPAASRIGDYELIRELGRGGFGVVYEARHTKSRNRVALKTLRTATDGKEINADRLYRFRREFRRLSEINHRNLIGMQTLEIDGSQWFFTMDLIEGEDFLSYVRPGDQLDEARLRFCLSQLAEGVIELHRRRIIHRDLKPGNVLVTRDGRVTILDFGLAAELQKATDMTQTRSGMFAGTPPYAAPEQMFGERTEASDWYAFGTILFEALAGERPFPDQNPMALMRQKEEQDPPKLAGRDGMPVDLTELADGLIRREPVARLTADSVSERLGLNQDTRSKTSTKESHGSAGSVDEEDAELGEAENDDIVLIGRDEQLAQLEGIKHEFTERREPRVVWITGLSGEGKSSLVEKFLTPIRLGSQMPVLAGRCYDRESVPFKAVDVLVESLTRFLRSQTRDDLMKWLPRDTHLLAHLFPALRRVKSIDKVSQFDKSRIDDRQIRYRAFLALRELLGRISVERVVVVFIDDLQWGDSDSAEVLYELLTSSDPPALLLIGSYRSDEAQQSAFLLDWERRRRQQDSKLKEDRVEVTPLTQDQCLQLMAQQVGFTSEQLREQAQARFADTKGNPYLLEQLIAGFDPATHQFESVPLSEVLSRKLERLPKEAAGLLDAISIAGQGVSIEEVSLVAGHETSLYSTIMHMRSERLVRLAGSESNRLVDTYHDKIRETVLKSLPKSVRQSTHRRFAELIERIERVDGKGLLEYLAKSVATQESLPSVSQRVFDMELPTKS